MSIDFPNFLATGPVTVESVLNQGVDWPKVLPGANSSSFDWWYFDAASLSTNQTVTVAFFNNGPDGFNSGYLNGPLSVSISGSFVNGSAFAFASPVVGGATVSTTCNAIYGNWSGSGFTFRGTNLVHTELEYLIDIDAPALGISGAIRLTSRAPPHTPCGPASRGAKQELLPGVFWANAVPDASASVYLNISGAAVEFADGIGYHDKNWGGRSFTKAISSLYWGHGRVGPYSVVWWDVRDSYGQEHVSGYVAKNRVVVSSSCNDNAVVVRPWGKNADYPPTPRSGIMQGLEIVFQLEDKSTLSLNVTTDLVLLQNQNYVRTTGRIKANVQEDSRQTTYHGLAHFEEFKY